MDRKRMAGTCTFGAKIKKYNYNFFKFQFEIALNGYLDKCLTWISLNALRKIQFTIGTNFWNTLYLKDSVNNSSQWCLEENGWFPTGSLGFYYANILREIFTILYQKIYGLSAMALQRAVFGTISNYSCIFACSYSLSHLFPPDYNNTCGGAGGGVKWGENGTYATLATLQIQHQPYLNLRKSFLATALGSSLLQPKGD